MNFVDESFEIFETLHIKRFHVPNQTDFGSTKCLPTALLYLIPIDLYVLAKQTKDIDEPQLEYLTLYLARTL